MPGSAHLSLHAGNPQGGLAQHCRAQSTNLVAGPTTVKMRAAGVG